MHTLTLTTRDITCALADSALRCCHADCPSNLESAILGVSMTLETAFDHPDMYSSLFTKDLSISGVNFCFTSSVALSDFLTRILDLNFFIQQWGYPAVGNHYIDLSDLYTTLVNKLWKDATFIPEVDLATVSTDLPNRYPATLTYTGPVR